MLSSTGSNTLTFDLLWPDLCGNPGICFQLRSEV